MNKVAMETPADLAGLVQYQDGSVVSQTLVKEKTGTVTAFAFDAGEGLSEHKAPFDALVLGIDGRATITIASESHSLLAGQILRLPADIPHSVRTEGRFKMLLIMIRSQDS